MREMKVNEAMLEAALHKAIEAGLFPRRCAPEERAAYRELMRAILAHALQHANDAKETVGLPHGNPGEQRAGRI